MHGFQGGLPSVPHASTQAGGAGAGGAILVFLPGAPEINKALRALQVSCQIFRCLLPCGFDY